MHCHVAVIAVCALTLAQTISGQSVQTTPGQPPGSQQPPRDKAAAKSGTAGSSDRAAIISQALWRRVMGGVLARGQSSRGPRIVGRRSEEGIVLPQIRDGSSAIWSGPRWPDTHSHPWCALP